MEFVVATVSGYHGSERFKLIKMISQAGASYVGAMNQSTTHLVCWKFQGRKYELARKFKTVIVNHQWIEECMKQGKRVPEHPYTFQCGQEVGPLQSHIIRLPTPPNTNMDSQEANFDIELEERGHAVWTDSTLLHEDLLHECGRGKSHSHRSQRKNDKRSSGWRHTSSSRHYFDEPSLHGSTSMESVELNSSILLVNEKRRSTASAKVARKGRRLVKNTSRHITDLDSDRDDGPIRVSNRNDDRATSSNNSDGGENASILRSGGAFDDRSYRYGRTRMENDGGIKDIRNPDIEDLSLHTEGTTSSLAGTSPDNSLATNNHLPETRRSTMMTASVELSCVICWTEFSSTRGVLPCGHRFCFSCIESWADHMTARGKTSTCPLCKASFVSITKVDGAVSSDQKIYSQTIPHDPLTTNVYILPGAELPILGLQPSGEPFCCYCCCREPEDLLVRCNLCQIRCIHSYCLDPPLFPWTCAHCKDLQMLYHRVW